LPLWVVEPRVAAERNQLSQPRWWVSISNSGFSTSVQASPSQRARKWSESRERLGRPSHDHQPNDRIYERDVVELIRRIEPEELDALLSGEGNVPDQE